MSNQVKLFKSLKFKIMLYACLCVMCFGVFSNLYVFHHVNRLITEKTQLLQQTHLSMVRSEIGRRFDEMVKTGSMVVNNYDVITALRGTDMDNPLQKQQMLLAQKVLDNSLYGSAVSHYVSHALLVSKEGTVVQTSLRPGQILDRTQMDRLAELCAAADLQDGPQWTVQQSLYGTQRCFVRVIPARSFFVSPGKTYLYLEMREETASDAFESYSENSFMFLHSGDYLISPKGRSDVDFLLADGQLDQSRFQVKQEPIPGTQLILAEAVPLHDVRISRNAMFSPMVLVIAATFLVSLCVMEIFGHCLMRPTGRLIARIEKIIGNDFSFDPEIEKGSDEISLIGRFINQMTASIGQLLNETREAAEEKSRAEMEMLQAQVNPHFLYNTLDTISWMASFQKVPAIEKMSRGLSRLLYNMSKGISDCIPLRDELALLRDYTDIQLVRYAGMFDFQCQVPEALMDLPILKMTLQPLVENCIVHGVAESTRFETIRVTAREDSPYLLLEVTDSCGMMPDDIMELKEFGGKKDALRKGIGLSNVNKRLKMAYGSDCGLQLSCRRGVQTCITVRLRKEGKRNVSGSDCGR